LGRDVINYFIKILLFGIIILYSCEGMYEPQSDYIDCSWFQYAEQQIYRCEDVSWCDQDLYPNEKVRLAWIYYTGTLPAINNELFTGGIDRIWYWSYKSDCIRYFNEENEIICDVIDEGGVKENIAGYIIAYGSQ
jgi:hypothetical protein|tara:strand:- start:55 stop:459 length:405 start_codon:yes stop_codon:yes gene_type:complete